MPVQLNATTGGGNVTITAPSSVTGTKTLTVPGVNGNIITSADSGTVTGAMLASATVAQSNLATNIAGNGPAFNAYANTNQSITSGVATKVTFAVEEFDTNNNFASSRFTPTVAGYYIITGFGYMLATASMTYGYVLIYKNGAAYHGSPFYVPYGSARSPSLVTVVMYLNGSGDYVEIYAQADGTSPVMDTASVGFQSRFSGALVRAA